MTMTPAFRFVSALARVLERAHVMPDIEKQSSSKRRQEKPPRILLRKPAPGISRVDRVVPGRSGDVAVRTYRTATPSDRAVVYLHGGGFMAGGPDSCDHICADLARLTNHLIVSVDYRLAPEDPFPAGLDDCDDVVQWVIASAGELGVDARDLAVAGDSAGGNLSAALCLRHRGNKAVSISKQVLIYPMLDLTCARDSWRTEAAGLIEPNRARTLMLRYAATPTNPLASPLFATELHGLPPALIITSQHDTLRDDGRDYAALLRGAEVPVQYTEYARMPHAFLSLSRLAGSAYDQALTEVATFLT